MLIDGTFEVAAPRAQVLAHLFDARLMASCLPGCESLERLDEDRYRAVIAMALAGVKARFDLVVQITGRDVNGIRAETRGEEGGNASTLSATSTVRLSPVGEGTRVDYTSDVAVTGRLGRFALGMMKKQAQNLGDAFAANLQARLAQESAAAPVAAAVAAPAGEAPLADEAVLPTPTVAAPAVAPAIEASSIVESVHPTPTVAAPAVAPAGEASSAVESIPPAPTTASTTVAAPTANGLVRWLRRLFGVDRAAPH